MKIKLQYLLWLLLIAAVTGCSKKNENYKLLTAGGEIYYPGVIFKPSHKAGNLRTMLLWNPSPDPKIKNYRVFWNNKQDSVIIDATSHDPADTVKVLIPDLKEGTYNFTIYSINTNGNISIPVSLNGVRVYGPIYQSGIFNRGYNADKPYTVKPGSVQLNFNQIKVDSVTINTRTVIKYITTAGSTQTISLKPSDSTVVVNDLQLGTPVTYQSSYLPFKGAIDEFTVQTPTTFPTIKLEGEVTGFFIKNPGYPFYRSDNGTGKWGLPKDWQYNRNVVNQDGGKGGGWSTDNGGVIHFESKDYSGDGITNGKVYQTISLPAGRYALEIETAGNGGTINANEIVALGESLPDIDNIGTPLALYHGDQNSIGYSHTLNFTLSQSSTVTIGWVVSTGSYTYLQFKGMKLRIL
ncbi:DUF4998 domain-containing protein [Mucilaginibacter psychrotolerans]|uniref:DUF5013 domain-containing protein n=1 Tax=Mucilaginibacter psychrotolerans TaxID=1524096 RepID=A0A4Y8SA08_9SPHI|nr:DUF4998 domain-containing protein [Mucilaginibacter psychrotolerans]TFF35475.1 DUF5013 domain-containing protein [Mucilaginibacter psychrotolerans]